MKEFSGYMGNVVKASVNCSDCGKRIVGWDHWNERLACKDAMENLRIHKDKCKTNGN